MNRLSEFLSQNIGVELWIATLVAIAIVTIVANQAAQVVLGEALFAAGRHAEAERAFTRAARTPESWPMVRATASTY